MDLPLSQLLSLDPGALALLGVALLVLLLLRVARTERRTVLIAAALSASCLFGLLLAGALAPELPALARSLRAVSVWGAGACVLCLLGTAVFRVALPAVKVTTPRILQDVVVAVAYVAWTFVWLRSNGLDLTGILATSAVLTAVIGLSLQDTLGNILGGLAIQVERSIRVGDWVQVDDITGQVVEIRWRYTALETRNWETVVIPNSILVKGKFRVLGRRTGEPVLWRAEIPFNVDFRYAPSQVIEIVEGAVQSADIARVAPRPQPNCVLVAFRESYAEYALRYWLSDLLRDEITNSDVRASIYSALRRAGIPLSIPAQSLFVTEETEARKALKQEQALMERVRALQRVDLFAGLEPDELERVARRLVAAPFARGDVITRQHAEAHWLYIIMDGRADVLVENGTRQAHKVAELGPGSFFGEMALMTGEPRSASVVARTAVECYRLDKEAFQDILRSRPKLAEEISSVLARRRTELETAREHLDAAARDKALSTARHDILARMRQFFGLPDDRGR